MSKLMNKPRFSISPYDYWCSKADRMYRECDTEGINDMLRNVNFLSMKCKTIAETKLLQLSLAKYLVEQCKATSIKSAACNTIDLPILQYFISLGANNYSKILNSSERNLETELYLMNLGAKHDFLDDFDKIRLLEAGAGCLLKQYPELLHTPEAKPYLQRKLDIAVILYKVKPDIPVDVIEVIVGLICYEI